MCDCLWKPEMFYTHLCWDDTCRSQSGNLRSLAWFKSKLSCNHITNNADKIKESDNFEVHKQFFDEIGIEYIVEAVRMETDSTGAKPRRRRTTRNNWNKGWRTNRRMNLSKSWGSVLPDWNYCFIENKSSLFAIPVVIDSNVLKCTKQSAILTNLSQIKVTKWFSGWPVDSVYRVLLCIPRNE